MRSSALSVIRNVLSRTQGRPAYSTANVFDSTRTLYSLIIQFIVSVGLSEEQKQIQQMAMDFAMSELKPNMQKWDKEHHFPVDKLRKAAELGFSGNWNILIDL